MLVYVYKSERWTTIGRREMVSVIRADRKTDWTEEIRMSKGLRGKHRKSKMFQEQLCNINKQLNVSRNQLKRNLNLLTSLTK